MGKTNFFKTMGLGLGILVATLAPTLSAAAGQIDFANPAFAQTGASQTSIPVGAADFCRTHRAECKPNGKVVAAVTLTQNLWKQLLSVNAKYNQTIVPETDQQLYKTVEFWTYPNGYGDCEDYALAKRRELIQLGWPASALLMTVARQQNGEGHAVLMVRTDRGDFILDNQEGLIKLWSDTPYKYVKRQSQANPGAWVDIYDSRPIKIASR